MTIIQNGLRNFDLFNSVYDKLSKDCLKNIDFNHYSSSKQVGNTSLARKKTSWGCRKKYSTQETSKLIH